MAYFYLCRAKLRGLRAGRDSAGKASDCPYCFERRGAERLLWFSGFWLGRARHRAPTIV